MKLPLDGADVNSLPTRVVADGWRIIASDSAGGVFSQMESRFLPTKLDQTGVMYFGSNLSVTLADYFASYHREVVPLALLERRSVAHFRFTRPQRLLDLSEFATRRILDVQPSDLFGHDYGPTQAVASWARQTGYEGVVYPSRLTNSALMYAIFGAPSLPVTTFALVENFPLVNFDLEPLGLRVGYEPTNGGAE